MVAYLQFLRPLVSLEPVRIGAVLVCSPVTVTKYPLLGYLQTEAAVCLTVLWLGAPSIIVMEKQKGIAIMEKEPNPQDSPVYTSLLFRELGPLERPTVMILSEDSTQGPPAKLYYKASLLTSAPPLGTRLHQRFKFPTKL